jgi:hypothetical protein
LTADPRPAGNQFSLRGLLVLITALSVIFALLALAIRQPLHWLGTLFVIGFCLLVIGILEGVRRFFPPQPRQTYSVYVPPPPANPLQTLDLTGGVNPFGAPPAGGEDPFAPRESPPAGEREA